MELHAKLVRSQLSFFKPFVANCSLDVTRKGQDKLGELMTALHRREVLVRDHDFEHFQGAWVMPKDQRRTGVILYLHGGGYTCGQLGYARILASKLALATGFDVLSFEYRLAPEHPFPAAIEDAVAMWDYLMYMGYGARDVIVAGDSAGGNLALELALKLKEQGRAQPRGLVLFSPWTDMTASGKSYRTCKTLDPMLTMEYIAAVREAYTGPDADWSRPCYSPLFADLRGLPPTLVQVGTNEILKSDSERLVENLQKAGVYAQLEVYPECWHVFQQMPIRRAAVAMESAGRFVQRII